VDDHGDNADLAAFFEDIRHGMPIEEAEPKHLLRGRTRESLAGEVQAYGRKLGVTVKFEPGGAGAR
jgi:hypothetical protein